MNKRDLFGWMVVGLNWYTIIVIGGISSIITGIFHRLYDLWLIIRREKDETKYLISRYPNKLLLSMVPLALGTILVIMTIFLIMPILMGVQHLIRTIFKKADETSNSSGISFKDSKKWYDGLVYSAGIDPGLKDVRENISGMISDKSNVIDICCGTGELAFTLANKCNRVVGIDHSSKMIAFAKDESVQREVSNVSFYHANAMNLSSFQDSQFDIAVLSLTLHEMPPTIRVSVLKEAKRISRNIIILDYKIPAPMNRNGISALFYEFAAGYDHLKHYLHFRDKKGLDYLFNELGLEKESELIVQNGVLEIVRIV